MLPTIHEDQSYSYRVSIESVPVLDNNQTKKDTFTNVEAIMALGFIFAVIIDMMLLAINPFYAIMGLIGLLLITWIIIVYRMLQISKQRKSIIVRISQQQIV